MCDVKWGLLLGFFNIKKWHMELITWNSDVDVRFKIVHQSPVKQACSLTAWFSVWSDFMVCLSFRFHHFALVRKPCNFAAIPYIVLFIICNLRSSLVYYLPRIQCSRISHRAFLLTSISSVSFHFSFGLNITSVEFYTLKLAKQTCTSIQNTTFFNFSQS